MKRSMKMGVVVLAVLASAMVVGCEDSKAKISALTSKNESLMMQNKDYQDQIAELEDYTRQLKEDSAGKDKLLAEQSREISALRAAPAKTVAAPAPAGGWERGKFGDKITVGSDILFSPGRATLRASGRRALDRIASELTGRYAELPVRVYGYTDSDPIRKSRKLWKDNLDLSSNRAMAVVRYLIKRGVPKDSIESIGMGDSNPVSSNSSRAGKARNRRVEIVVVKIGD